MKDILNEIVANKRVDNIFFRSQINIDEIHEKAKNMPPVRSMSRSIKESKSGIIAEFKRRSPSKGWLKRTADPAVIPSSYELAGAAAISVLVDCNYFGGSFQDLETARRMCKLPLLCKEFIIDEIQVYKARTAGADAILLIAAALTPESCRYLAQVAHSVGLEVLLELHSAAELHYICEDIDMVGVNNRNLGSFNTNVKNSFEMIDKLPKGIVKISESGIHDPEVVSRLRKVGYQGFLIGENFMISSDPGFALRQFISAIR